MLTVGLVRRSGGYARGGAWYEGERYGEGEALFEQSMVGAYGTHHALFERAPLCSTRACSVRLESGDDDASSACSEDMLAELRALKGGA